MRYMAVGILLTFLCGLMLGLRLRGRPEPEKPEPQVVEVVKFLPCECDSGEDEPTPSPEPETEPQADEVSQEAGEDMALEPGEEPVVEDIGGGLIREWTAKGPVIRRGSAGSSEAKLEARRARLEEERRLNPPDPDIRYIPLLRVGDDYEEEGPPFLTYKEAKAWGENWVNSAGYENARCSVVKVSGETMRKRWAGE